MERRLPPAHAVLVDELRALVEQYGQPPEELGKAVRHRLGQAVPVRPVKPISRAGHRPAFPTRAELEAIVGLCTHDLPAQLEHFRKLWGAADRERMARRRGAADVGDDLDLDLDLDPIPARRAHLHVGVRATGQHVRGPGDRTRPAQRAHSPSTGKLRTMCS